MSQNRRNSPGLKDKEEIIGKCGNLKCRKFREQIIAAINKATSERRLFSIEGAPFTGNPDAPVTVVEFSDYQCPYCSRMAMYLKEIKDKYPEDLKVVWMDLPLISKYKDGYPFHPYAYIAHEVSTEAAVQGKFWEMNDYIFTNQRSIFPGRPKSEEEYKEKQKEVREKLVAQAEVMGMDVDKLNKALDNQTHRDRLNELLNIAQKMNIHGTPTLYINSYIKLGDPKNIAQYIDEAKGN